MHANVVCGACPCCLLGMRCGDATQRRYAGLALGKGPAHTNDTGDITTMLDTNCKAVAILTRDVAAGMVKRDYVGLLRHACGVPFQNTCSCAMCRGAALLVRHAPAPAGAYHQHQQHCGNGSLWRRQHLLWHQSLHSSIHGELSTRLCWHQHPCLCHQPWCCSDRVQQCPLQGLLQAGPAEQQRF